MTGFRKARDADSSTVSSTRMIVSQDAMANRTVAGIEPALRPMFSPPESNQLAPVLKHREGPSQASRLRLKPHVCFRYIRPIP